MKKFYTTINNSFIKEFDKQTTSAKDIVITAHISPDDDAISSVLSVYAYLTKHRKVSSSKVRMIFTGKETDRWKYFKNFEKVEFVDDLANELVSTDLLIALDGSGWYRFSKKESIRQFEGYTICIDHHPNPEDKHDLHLVATNYTACAEILYLLFFKNLNFDKDTAETLFLGIWGDTGGMRFVRPDEEDAFPIVGNLINKFGINIQTLTAQYQKIDMNIFSLITALMKNTEIKKVEGWPAFQWSYLEPKYLKKGYTDNQYKTGYHMYMDQYLRMIEGADWGFVVIPKEGGVCGISFRSLPQSVNVRKIAEAINGGGHDRAAGGEIKVRNPKKAFELLLDYLKHNKPVID